MFLDGYAGSGAVGIEAVSRGARQAILIEKNAQAVATIRKNVKALKIENEIIIVRGRVAAVVNDYKVDIAFIDPPYEEFKEYGVTLMALAASRCPLVIAQHASRTVLPDEYGALNRFRILRQGDNSLSFYEYAPESGSEKQIDVHDIRSGGAGLD